MEEKGQYELSIRHDVTPEIWEMIKSMAPVMHQARLFGVTSMEQAAAIMLKGHELGIGITASFELVQVVMGKPSLTPRGALALLHSAPEIKTIKVTRLVDPAGKFTGYECFISRSNGFEFTTRFTLEDAKRAGLIKPDSGWANYPENMCMWRAIGFCADVVAPDITAGLTASLKMPERFGAGIDDGGNLVMDVMPTPPPFDTEHLTALIAQYGTDAVIGANGGNLPATNGELDAIEEVLKGGPQ